MKAFFLFFILNVLFIRSEAQNPGNIRQISSSVYEYTPPSKLALPKDLYASLAYRIGEEHYFIRKPLTSKNKKLSFTFSPSSPVKAFILAVTDSKQQTIDNNNDTGYIVTPDQKPGNLASSKAEAVWLLSYFARNALRLDHRVLDPKMLALYEEAFQLSPALRDDHKTFRFYLFLKNQQKGEAVKPELLEYAGKMETSNDETSLSTALYIYKFLREEDLYNRLHNKCISLYPTGIVAREKFIDEFYDKRGKTEQSILHDAQEYIRKFGDSSSQMKYTFYLTLTEYSLFQKQYQHLHEYEQIMNNHIVLASSYMETARRIIKKGNHTDSSLLTAGFLTQKAFRIIAAKTARFHTDPDDITHQNIWNQVATTYANILFLRKQYDSAFYYQSMAVKHNINPQNAGAAALLLVTYAAKAKGDQYARTIALSQIKKGNASPELANELNQMNQRLGIHDTAGTHGSWTSPDYVAEKMAAAIRKRFGSQNLRNFTLTDLSGETVSLSQFENKIIVLDFWASWCGPCKESFPHMQNVVTKYKQDSSVVFLFIDTFEKYSLEKMKAGATKFLQEKKYDFRVLLDDMNIANNTYKVDYIPETFIISKQGKIVYMDSSNASIIQEIENAKKLTY